MAVAASSLGACRDRHHHRLLAFLVKFRSPIVNRGIGRALLAASSAAQLLSRLLAIP